MIFIYLCFFFSIFNFFIISAPESYASRKTFHEFSIFREKYFFLFHFPTLDLCLNQQNQKILKGNPQDILEIKIFPLVPFSKKHKKKSEKKKEKMKKYYMTNENK